MAVHDPPRSMTDRRRLLLSLAMVAIVAVAVAVSQLGRAQPVGPSPTPSAIVLATATEPPASPTTPAAPPTLRTNGLARIAPPGGLRVWRSPSKDAADKLKHPLPSGAVVFLVRGPRTVAGVSWWQVQPDRIPGIVTPFGWVSATDAAGGATLLPFVPACPSTDGLVDAKVIKDIGTLAALSCFRHRDITLQGEVTCTAGVEDFAVGGPSWLDPNGLCKLDDALFLDGAAVAGLVDRQGGATTGRYEVRGHFDDPEAQACHWISIGGNPHGVAPPDPEAVMACRQSFVVSSVTGLH